MRCCNTVAKSGTFLAATASWIKKDGKAKKTLLKCTSDGTDQGKQPYIHQGRYISDGDGK
jgi:hypothetical protein